MRVKPALEKAYQAALSCRRHSYSPYSRFPVGAALKLHGHDDAVVGCNVENASFGATICAERVAIHAAIAQHGRFEAEFLVIVTGEKAATVPCALCLQVIAEFCADSFPIYLGNHKSLLKKYTLRQLLPHAFRSFKSAVR